MKDIYIIDIQVKDCLGEDTSKNYLSMPYAPGAQTITRYDVEKYPHVLSTKAYQMNYYNPQHMSYNISLDMTKSLYERYEIPVDTAVVYGSFAIGLGVRYEFEDAFHKGQTRFSPSKLFANNHDLISSIVSAKLKTEGVNTGMHAACSTSLFNMHYGASLIQSGEAPMAVVGAVDTPLFPMMQYYWQCTSAISTKDGGSSIPFDVDRDGFLQGEGGSMWLLADGDSVIKYGLKPIAKLRSIVVGAKVATIAAHDKTGEHQCKMIDTALRLAKLQPQDISLYNAHATSTPLGDDTEVLVFQRSFKDLDIPIVSFKGYIGHTMSASGIIEASYGIEAIKTGLIHPNKNLVKPLDPDPRILTQQRSLKGSIQLKASFGFGGRTAIAVIENL